MMPVLAASAAAAAQLAPAVERILVLQLNFNLMKFML
jgi:hypothetical protein